MAFLQAFRPVEPFRPFVNRVANLRPSTGSGVGNPYLSVPIIHTCGDGPTVRQSWLSKVSVLYFLSAFISVHPRLNDFSRAGVAKLAYPPGAIISCDNAISAVATEAITNWNSLLSFLGSHTKFCLCAISGNPLN